MAVLESHVELGEEHERRRARMEQLVADLRERTARVGFFFRTFALFMCPYALRRDMWSGACLSILR